MTGAQVLLYSLVSTIAGLMLTVAARVIDKWLPDPDNKHPLPPLPDLDGDGKPG